MSRRVVSSDFAKRRTSSSNLACCPANLLVDRQKGIDDSAKLMILRHQFDDMVPQRQADRPSEQQPIFLDHAADLIFLEIPANANQARSGNEDGADPLTLLALDLYLAIPTHPDQFG